MRQVIAEGVVAIDESFVAVAAGPNEAALFQSLGIEDATITNLDTSQGAEGAAPYPWSRQAAQDLGFDDASFDWGFVVDGLHHCPSPHAGLLELYRVARRGVIAFEARDSALMRVAARARLTGRYEIEAVVAHGGEAGGVDNSPVPNHVYRWTESEFEKTIRSYDPTGEQRFRYAYALHLPWQSADMHRGSVRRGVLRVAEPVLKAATAVAKKQRNSIAMIVEKPVALHPWLRADGDRVQFDPTYGQRHFR
jgi:SAM-dependent methyltransferase